MECMVVNMHKDNFIEKLMEFVLLIVILIVLLYMRITLSTKIKSLQKHMEVLHHKLDALKKPETIHMPDSAAQQGARTGSTPTPETTKPLVGTEHPEVNLKIPPAAPIPERPMVQSSTTSKQVADAKIKAQIAALGTKKASKMPKPSLWERFKTKNPDLEKFIGEHLINKFGILILVLGISYFVRFAIDKNWINEPARVGIGLLVGILIIGIAHRMRKKYVAFGSVLVAGGVAVFYFTIAIAFHEYQLFSQTVTFVIMVLITAFSCLLSLSYNRRELAILSLIGGFAVPFMISTGSGNYLVLFTYIAILDIGILTLAYFKRWTLVNLLAFIFTTLLFGGWLFTELDEEQPHYLGALAFGFLFYVLFVITNIINNMRTKGVFSKVQLGMLAVNTFVFYGIGMIILSEYHSEFLGLFTAILAVLNMGYASFLYNKFGLDKIAVYLLIGLTLTFITLAIPIQFEGNYITLFWALEAVLLMWLAQKSKIKWYRFASVLVQLLMVLSLCIDWGNFYSGDSLLPFVFNPIFSTGIVAVASLLSVRYFLSNETEKISYWILTLNPRTYRKILVVGAIIVGYFVGMFEIVYQSDLHLDTYGANSLPMVFHLLYTGVLCFFLYRKRVSVRLTGLLALVNIMIFAFVFSRVPFLELKENLMQHQNKGMAFYIHLVSLVLVGYFFYVLYTTQMLKKALVMTTLRLDIWIMAFLLSYIISTEVLLAGLRITNMELVAEVEEALNNRGYDTVNAHYDKQSLAGEILERTRDKIIKTALPVTWGVLAFGFLIVGIKRQIKSLRIIALTLLGITILKLFAYDIQNVSETGKISAFILLGILILIISFIYQKIKKLVIDDDNVPNDEHTL